MRTSVHPRSMAKAPIRGGRTRHLKVDGSTASLDGKPKDGRVFHYMVFKALLSRSGTYGGSKSSF